MTLFNVVDPSHVITYFQPNAAQLIEVCGRVCYKSEDRITPDSAAGFVRKLRARRHLSVIEHVSASVHFVFSRGVSHELVRHRLCAISQESTRYCNYGNKGLTFIRPLKLDIPCRGYTPDDTNEYAGPARLWLTAMAEASFAYNTLLECGWTPQDARDVLPNSLKTELVLTANLREWLHIFELRTAEGAHPDMIRSMLPVFRGFQLLCPEVFCG